MWRPSRCQGDHHHDIDEDDDYEDDYEDKDENEDEDEDEDDDDYVSGVHWLWGSSVQCSSHSRF